MRPVVLVAVLCTAGLVVVLSGCGTGGYTSEGSQGSGKKLFIQACGGCHTLADAGGTGGVGPSLDANPRLTHDYVVGAISEGRGAMPAFRDQMTADEIAALAAYIVQVARK